MESNKYIQIRCKQCKRHFFDYEIINKDDSIVLQGISIKCDRCSRVVTLKKYTEGFLISHSKKSIFKI